MKFNSIQFLLFLPIIAILYYVCPQRWRWILLLGASYLFYMSWNPKYIIVLLTITAIGYLAGLLLARDVHLTTRRIILAISLFTILGILFFFKYFDLSNSFLLSIFDKLDNFYLVPRFNILLPLGASYFTFQTMSYTIDVFRGITKPEKHAGIFALFIAFFPHLPAGPIARANLLMPQFYEHHMPEYEKIVSGLQRMVWGFFKKLVIADRLALLVNLVYGDPTAYSGIVLIFATYAFAFQVYCDFSGYADIAIGAARVMGFKLTENFQQPYYAQSIPEFWRRWHISLYDWLRDYIFYPISRALRRSRVNFTNFAKIIIPLMATMLASGLWHGTKWTFIVWGALHGVYMVCSVYWSRIKNSLSLPLILPSRVVSGIKIFTTFNLVCFAWIFFRANSLTEAVYIIQHLFVNTGTKAALLSLLPGGWYEWTIALIAILLMETVHWLQMKTGVLHDLILPRPAWLRWLVYYGLIIVIFMFGKFETIEFIYTRF